MTTPGFCPQPRTYTLVFEDPQLAGLVVRAKSVTVGDFMEATGLGEDDALGGVTLPVGMPLRPSILQRFADSIASWNLTDTDGGDIAPSAKALHDQELWVSRAMVKAWLEAVSGISSELGKGSGSGETSAEQSLGLESASQSLEN